MWLRLGGQSVPPQLESLETWLVLAACGTGCNKAPRSVYFDWPLVASGEISQSLPVVSDAKHRPSVHWGFRRTGHSRTGVDSMFAASLVG